MTSPVRRPHYRVSQVAPMKFARAESPVRIDLFGSWSDHPDFLRSRRSRIVNCAVTFERDQFPVWAELQRTGRGAWYRSLDLGIVQALREDTVLTNPIVATLSTLHTAADELVKRQHGLRLTTWSATPFRSGLGTSASLSVATLEAACLAFGWTIGPQQVAEWGYRIEDRVHQCGWQDHYAAAYGGALLITREWDAEFASVTRLPSAVAAVLNRHAFIVIPNISRPNDFSWAIDERTMNVICEMDTVLEAFLKIADVLTLRSMMSVMQEHARLYRRIGSRALCSETDRILQLLSSDSFTTSVLGFGPAVLVLGEDVAAARTVLEQTARYRCFPVRVAREAEA